MFATSANKSTANTATQHFINNNTNSNGLLNNGMMHLDNQVNNHLINNVNHIYQNQISTCGESYTPLSDKGYPSLSSMIRNIGTSTIPNINTTPQKNSNLNKLQLTNNSNLVNLNYQNGQNFSLQNVALQQPNNTLAYHFSQDLLNQHQLQNIQHNNLISNVPQQLINGSQLPLQPKQLPQHNIPNIFCNLKNQCSTPQNSKHQQIQQQQQHQPLTLYNMHQNNNFMLQKPDQSSQMNTGMTQSHQFYQHPSLQTLQQQQLQQIYLQLNNQNNPNLINRNLINNATNHNLINRNLFNVNTTNNDSNYYNNLMNCQNLNANLQTNSMNNKSLINNNITSTANNIDFQTTTSSFSNVSNKSESNDTVILGQLRNFKILKQIGTGQFSVVYRAVYLPTGQLFALKCIRIFELGDMKTRLDCINEISLLQRLDNPNIIKFYTSFVECNELYIVLEWADSGDLAQLLKNFRKLKKNIPERKIWFYFQQIANGLMHMHENCILHRDIKPPNVFITLAGVIKLGDLGLSKYYGGNCKGNCCCNSGNGFCLSNKEKNNNSSLDTRAILENHFNTLLSQKNNKNNPQNSVSLNNLVKACTQQVRNNITDHKDLHYKLHKHLMQDEANSLIGTPFFMPPEKLQQNCKYDSQSDIWSLGCILYEMAALQSPFFGEKLNLVSLCQKIARCDYPPLSNQYSVALRALVASCLNTDPKQRPEISLICDIAKYCSGLSSKELQVAHLYSPLFSTLKIDEIVNNDKINQYKLASTMSPLKGNNVYCLNGINGRQAKSFNVNNQTNSNLSNQNHNLQNPLANCIPNNQTIVTDNLKNFSNAINENFFNTTNGSNLANDCNNYNDLQSIDSDNTDSLLQLWKFEPDNEKNFI